MGGDRFNPGSGGSFDYDTLSAGANYSNDAAGSTTLQFSINGGASSSNAVAINLATGDATAATVASSDTSTGSVAINPNNNQLNLVVDGTAVTVSLSTSGAATKNDIANQITSALSGASVAAAASVVGNAITITSTNKGAGNRSRFLRRLRQHGFGL